MKKLLKSSLLLMVLLSGCNSSKNVEFVELLLTTDEKMGQVCGSGTYLQGSTVSILAVPNNLYSFYGWYSEDELISKEPRHTFKIDEDLTYTASFGLEAINLELFSNNPDECYLIGSGAYSKNEEITISAVLKDGYKFDGWYEKDRLISNNNPYTFNIGEISRSIEAKTSSNKHQVLVITNDEELGDVNGAGFYRYKSLVTLTAKSKTGSRFVGFYDKDDKLLCDEEIYSFIMEDTSYILTARFEKIKYEINVDIYNNETKKYSSRIGEVNFMINNQLQEEINNIVLPYKQKVTLIPQEKSGFKFSCWVDKNVTPNTFKFEKELSIDSLLSNQVYECRFSPLEEGNSLLLGSYPQSLVPSYETDLLDNLNSLINDVPKKDNHYDWTSFKYENQNQNDFMFYKDIKYQSETFRVVYLLEYRNNRIDVEQDENFNQYLNGFNLNTPYFFRFEPIRWNVIKSSNNSILSLKSEMILDSLSFSNLATLGSMKDTSYPSNYKESFIRTWLNSTFLSSALRDEDFLINALIKNDYKSAGSSSDFIYTCDDTLDYVYLLSQQEANYYFSGESRRHISTDYAKIMGLDVSSTITNLRSPWLLRSPTSDDENKVRYVLEDGSTIGKANILYTGLGIVPCISLDISLY